MEEGGQWEGERTERQQGIQAIKVLEAGLRGRNASYMTCMVRLPCGVEEGTKGPTNLGEVEWV